MAKARFVMDHAKVGRLALWITAHSAELREGKYSMVEMAARASDELGFVIDDSTLARNCNGLGVEYRSPLAEARKAAIAGELSDRVAQLEQLLLKTIERVSTLDVALKRVQSTVARLYNQLGEKTPE